MNCNDRYIVELSRAAIFDDTPFSPDIEVDWDYIYKKSILQNISGLLFCAVDKLKQSEQPKQDIIAEWRKTMLNTVAVNAGRYNEFSKMMRISFENGLKLVGLKGCIIRELYPVPELRTMGDFDVLVSKRNMGVVKAFFEENGYKTVKDSYGIVCEGKKGYWEIFYSLDEEFAVNTEKHTKAIFESSQRHGVVYRPDITYFLAHVIIHTARHYMEKGAGIRNVCDVALIVNKYKNEIDFDLLEKLCEEQNYKNIYGYLINAIGQYFGVDISGIKIEKRNCDKFLEYALLNGIYGRHGNTLLWQVAKDEDESNSGIKRLLFPSVKNLKNRYKYLEKLPILLPVAWIHRVFAAFFKWKYSFRQMRSDVKEAFEFSDERIKWMKELGLQDKH